MNAIVQIIGAVFAEAIEDGKCTVNPLARIKRKRTKKAARELEPGEVGGAQDGVSKDAVLSPAEIRKLLDAAPAGYYRTLITTAFISGMRSGELLALRWSD